MKLSSTQKEMLRGIPTKEVEFPSDHIKIRAFKVGDGQYMLHKQGPDAIGMTTNFITRESVDINQIFNYNHPAYEEIEY